MTEPTIMKAMEYLDDDLIAAAAERKAAPRLMTKRKFVALLAACLLLVGTFAMMGMETKPELPDPRVSWEETMKYNIELYKDDAEMLSDGVKNAHSIFFSYDRKWRDADILLEDGDKITIGNETIEVISTPGHSKGSICLLCGDKLLCGDTLFANGYGRYDLHGGDFNQLINSLSALRDLDGKLTIYPGHGDSATLSHALDNVLYY